MFRVLVLGLRGSMAVFGFRGLKGLLERLFGVLWYGASKGS